MRNIIYDIENDIFHMDYFLAVITSLFWLRCLLLLKLSETFGPLLEMIFAMFLVFSQFIVLYILELLTLSCIAALVIQENPNFSNIFKAFITYLSASLGHFDLEQYDDYPGFKGMFGLLLHVIVLFINMILIINLMIAIMSDTYARLAEARVGLYWSSVIKEMPKYAFHREYGVLVMFPFCFSFIGLFMAPFLVTVKSKKRLQNLNQVCFMI